MKGRKKEISDVTHDHTISKKEPKCLHSKKVKVDITLEVILSEVSPKMSMVEFALIRRENDSSSAARDADDLQDRTRLEWEERTNLVSIIIIC